MAAALEGDEEGKLEQPPGLVETAYTSSITDEERATMALLSAEDVEGAPPWVCDEFAKLRFTRARPGKPEQAVELYKEMLAWREAYGTDGLFEAPKHDAVIAERYPLAWTGLDRDGHPVLVIRFNRADFPGMLRESTLDALFARNVVAYEEALKLYRGQQFVAVLDINVNDFCRPDAVTSWIKSMMKFVKALAKLEAYYPEVIHKVAFTNQPWMFSTVWRMIRPFLAKATVAKVVVLGTDADKLRAVVPNETLPPFLGGTSGVEFPGGGRVKAGEGAAAAAAAGEGAKGAAGAAAGGDGGAALSKEEEAELEQVVETISKESGGGGGGGVLAEAAAAGGGGRGGGDDDEDDDTDDPDL